jgi:hypothetical protein
MRYTPRFPNEPFRLIKVQFMRVYSSRLIAAVALAFAVAATAQVNPDANTITGSTDAATLASTDATTDGQMAEFFEGAGLYATPLPTALLLLGCGLLLARRAAAYDRRRTRVAEPLEVPFGGRTGP